MEKSMENEIDTGVQEIYRDKVPMLSSSLRCVGVI